MNARYNGYFYADLYLTEVFAEIANSYQYKYDQILKIYPDIDSGIINSNKQKLEDAFKKSSQVIEWYGSSDWTDDNYLIIGKIRHLRAEFQFAIETLQYINQTSTDDPTRHAALIVLMQTYMDLGDKEKAIDVANFLETQQLTEENMANYKVQLAYFNQREGDFEAMAKHLKEVSEIVPERDTKSRINFILGQIEQANGNNAEAYKYYEASLKGTPPYDLTFYARLNMKNVSSVRSPTEIEKIRKFYADLLKDGKNKEFRGKIYYEMGEFEKRLTNYDLALDNYFKAVAVEEPSPRQKSLSYLRAGQLYFEVYEKFELASKYYDSAVAIMPTDVDNYLVHSKRKEVLNEFVTQLKTISKNDSLLSLAELNPVSLDAFLDAHLDDLEEDEREKQKEERRNAATTGAANASGGAGFSAGNNSGDWYFYNDAAVELGALEFQRRWGNRPLEDNWRRSTKETVFNDENTEESVVVEDVPIQESIAKSSNARKAKKEELLATIPTTAEAREKLHLENQAAYFKLGRVYRFGLERVPKAASTYKTLIEKYPKTEFKLETLFALYTIYQDTDASQANIYKQQIIDEFPESLIAKTLINPNYSAEKEARNKALQQVYATAYRAYENGEYVRADQILRDALKSFEDVDFLPTVQLLAVILKAKTESLFSYEQGLNDFISKYPDGKLNLYAKDLLAALKPVKESIVRSEDFEYSEDFKLLHLVSVVFEQTVTDGAQLKALIEAYNNETFSHLKLSIGQLVLDESKNLGIMFINSFADKKTAEAYNRALSKAMKGFKIEVDSNFNNFAISRDNFQMLYQSKELDTYLKFHKKFYQ
ncbi:MAG: outer membrane protein assembly factor BamD (BamD/ComL family) [Roseivirga sp.]|jgi:outer membrane protein assembly factor BamD (BamD/ComL family)